MQKEKLCWLAGIIDGEGSLSLIARQGLKNKIRHSNGGIKTYFPRVSIGNTDMEMIKEVSEILCDNDVKFYYQLRNKNKNFPNAKQMVYIQIEGYRSVKKIIELISPLLKTGQKTRQAKKILEYIEFRLSILESNKRSTHPQHTEDQFMIDMKEMGKYQVPPSTTKRLASTPLSW